MHKQHLQRFYHPGESYFITTRTKDRYSYFLDPGCCKILIENMRLAKKLLNFDIYAFIIMPDHFHWLICPKGRKNISQIMHFVKRNTSREINDKVRGYFTPVPPVAKDHDPWLQGVNVHKAKIKNIIVNLDQLFQWQTSFYDRLIRDEIEFNNVLNYINEKNLADLIYKYKTCTEENAKDYPFYSYTTPDLIDAL